MGFAGSRSGLEGEVKKWLGAAAVTAAIMVGAPAYAATTFTQINQTALDTLGTSDFGAIIDTEGAFDHTFNFTTTDAKTASSAVISILLDGGWDIDFTSVSLDGNAFTLQTGDPAESWKLTSADLTAGNHSIHIIGTVIASTQSDAGSYGGTLNVSAEGNNNPGGGIPEPATWAMMITGFGGVGAIIRRRRTPMLA
jgi:hypothetical protein